MAAWNGFRRRSSLLGTGIAVPLVVACAACGGSASTSAAQHVRRHPAEARAHAHRLYLKATATLRNRHVEGVDLTGPPDAVALSALGDMSLAGSINSGEPHPRDGEVFTATRRRALASLGTGVDSDEPSYLVKLRGHFVGYLASMPEGTSGFPVGSYLWALYDAKTLALRFWGITDKDADLSELGPPTSLPLG